MTIQGHTDYQRREYCKAIKCEVQLALEAAPEGSDDYQAVRAKCINACIHTTYEFHHWLIEKGYLLVRPVK